MEARSAGGAYTSHPIINMAILNVSIHFICHQRLGMGYLAHLGSRVAMQNADKITTHCDGKKCPQKIFDDKTKANI
jgi:hypothetical protein